MQQVFELTILGCSSATPTSQRLPTAQLLNIAERFFLIDCGEGTQIQLRKYKFNFQKIEAILISHLHGDHYLGLMGLLQSMHLLGRKKKLLLFCQSSLKEIIDVQLKHSYTELNYPIEYHFLSYDKSELIYEDNKVSIHTIILNHRIPCCGFIFKEKQVSGNLIKEALEKHQIPLSALNNIKKGEDFQLENGTVIPNSSLLTPGPPPRSYAFCSDTRYDESILEIIAKADLLYHEATFMQDLLERAKETFHSTASEAGTIAMKAEVKKLLIGHYSARYKELEPLLEEAKAVFNETYLAIEGDTHQI